MREMRIGDIYPVGTIPETRKLRRIKISKFSKIVPFFENWLRFFAPKILFKTVVRYSLIPVQIVTSEL